MEDRVKKQQRLRSRQARRMILSVQDLISQKMGGKTLTSKKRVHVARVNVEAEKTCRKVSNETKKRN